jgi:hypothetical protein
MENETILIRLPAENYEKSDIFLALDSLLGTGNYVLTEEPEVGGFNDEELGFSPEVASFLVSIVTSTLAKVFSNLLASELEKIKKPNKKD